MKDPPPTLRVRILLTFSEGPLRRYALGIDSNAVRVLLRLAHN
jgi:hypothetical protein